MTVLFYNYWPCSIKQTEERKRWHHIHYLWFILGRSMFNSLSPDNHWDTRHKQEGRKQHKLKLLLSFMDNCSTKSDRSPGWKHAGFSWQSSAALTLDLDHHHWFSHKQFIFFFHIWTQTKVMAASYHLQIWMSQGDLRDILQILCHYKCLCKTLWWIRLFIVNKTI